jgi:gliding motility-associated-like protein
VKKILAAFIILISFQSRAQTICDSLARVPKEFDLSAMTDSTRFMPVFANDYPDQYSFEIRDNWGEKIFSTAIPQQGWNGLRNNRSENCAAGSYMWVMNCTWNEDSITINCSGYVTCKNMQAPVKIIGLDTIQCTPGVNLPNAFTPNGDGTNDVFIPLFGCPPIDYEMQIFDRWGYVVFSTKDVNVGWDGKISPSEYAKMDTYVWKISFRLYEGDKLRKYTGYVVLVR